MKDSIEVLISIDKELPFYLGEEATGQITLTALENISLEYVELRLFIEVRGWTGNQQKEIQYEELSKEVKLKAGESFSYPYTLVNKEHETYKGKYVEVLARLEVTVKMLGIEKGNQFLSTLASLNPLKKKKINRFLSFSPRNQEVKLAISDTKLTHNFDVSLIFSSILLMLLFFISAAYSNMPLNYMILMWSIGLLLIIGGLGINIIHEFLVGKISALFEDVEPGQFELSLRNSRDWKMIKEIDASYRVIEEVVDNRGTNRTNAEFILFSSRLKVNRDPRKIVNFLFDYPKKHFPILDIDNVRIYWILEVKIYLFANISYSLTKEFPVKYVS